MNSCLDNLIGFRVCGYEESESGLYIDDMPGGKIARLAAMTDPERISAAAVWQRVKERASAFFASDIRRAIPQNFKTADILSNVITGDRTELYTSPAAVNSWCGVYVRVYGTPLMQFTLNWVRVWLETAGTIPVRVFDCQTTEELYSKDFTGIKGDNILNTKFSVPMLHGTREFFIAYNNAGLDTYDTTVNDMAWCMAHGISPYGSMSGAHVANNVSNPTTAMLTMDGSGNGLIASYSLRCSLDGFICNNRMSLATAFLLRCMIELYREIREGDDIINRYTLINTEEINARTSEYMQMYMDELTGVLAKMDISDPLCIECSAPIQTDYVSG